jgi:hypothetical protein
LKLSRCKDFHQTITLYFKSAQISVVELPIAVRQVPVSNPGGRSFALELKAFHAHLGGLVMWILNKKVIQVKYFIPSLAK